MDKDDHEALATRHSALHAWLNEILDVLTNLKILFTSLPTLLSLSQGVGVQMAESLVNTADCLTATVMAGNRVCLCNLCLALLLRVQISLEC